jgi:hypothetical protein
VIDAAILPSLVVSGLVNACEGVLSVVLGFIGIIASAEHAAMLTRITHRLVRYAQRLFTDIYNFGSSAESMGEFGLR